MKTTCIIIAAHQDEPFTSAKGKTYVSRSFFMRERGSDPAAELCQQIKVRLSESEYDAGVLNGKLPKVDDATGKQVELTISNIVGVRQNVVEVTGVLSLPNGSAAKPVK